MPQYMLLIYAPAEGGPTPEEMEAEMPRWFEFDAAIRESGAFVSGDALHPAQTATTVRVRDGDTLSTDGPFAETKEVLGGYYVVDVQDREAAHEWAARLPNAPYGSVEVRELMVFDAPGDPSAAQSSAEA